MITFDRRLDKIEKRLNMRSSHKSTRETANEIEAYFDDIRQTKEQLPEEERKLREEISVEASRIVNDGVKRAGIEDSLTEMIYYLRNKPKIEELLLRKHGLEPIDKLIEDRKTAMG